MDASEKPRKVKRGKKKSPVASHPSSPAPTHPPEPPVAPDAVDQARRKRIAKLKQSIEDGTYSISNDEVARKLIEHMLELKD